MWSDFVILAYTNQNTIHDVETAILKSWLVNQSFLSTIPNYRWYALKNKAVSFKKEKYRGELEISLGFTVKNLSEAERKNV